MNSEEELTLIRKNLYEVPSYIIEKKLLKSLCLSDNQLMSLPVEIGHLTLLQKLYVNNNNLTNLPKSFGGLTSLHILYLSHNQLTELPSEIGNLVLLIYMFCNNNKLMRIPSEIGCLTSLQRLDLSHNKLTKIPESLGNLISLQHLWLDFNMLTEIPESIGNLSSLQLLDFSQNQLRSLPMSLLRLRNLQSINIYNNQIEYTCQALLRIINNVKKYTQTHVNIYNDKQSVHNSSIQKSVFDSLYKILNEIPLESKVLNDFIIDNKVLTEECKRALIEYSSDEEVHSLLGVTFRETLEVVLSIIIKSPEKDEILRIMNQEMSDAMCMCFTGRIMRLLNTLNGFDDRVSITISDSEQISAIVETCRKKTSDAYAQRELVTNEMTERGYSKDVIDEWTQYL
jgi:Leucine-rich repeat (LRR) protein